MDRSIVFVLSVSIALLTTAAWAESRADAPLSAGTAELIRPAQDGHRSGGIPAEQAKPSQSAPNQGDGSAAPAKEPLTLEKALDELFRRLNAASDPDEAKGIEGAIERLWLRSGSDTADILMVRALSALEAKDVDLARSLLDKIVVVEPEWAEAWNKRATVRYLQDDLNGSMEDIGHVLALEPRHYGALAGMGFILQRSGLDKRALQAFRRALEVNPQLEQIRKIVEKLSIDVEGRDI